GETQLAVQLERVRAGRLHGGPDAVFGDDHVADGVRLRVEDAEVGGVHPAGAIGAETGVLGHLEAQMLPAAEPRGESRTGSAVALPEVLRAEGALEDGLFAPVEVDGATEGTTRRPLDVGAQRARRRVDVDHS